MQFERELPSKLLYTWIQKKGRQVYSSENNYKLDKEETKENAIKFFHTLNKNESENGRVAFVIKYFKAQFNINVTSKELNAWLSDKGKKAKGKKK